MRRIRTRTIDTYHNRIAVLLPQWQSCRDKGVLLKYIFNQGVFHLLYCNHVDQARMILADFDLLMARLTICDAQEIIQIANLTSLNGF